MEKKQDDPLLVEHGRFQVRIAGSAAEIEAAQKLRCRVFGRERSSQYAGRDTLDEDVFDRQFRHLIVIDADSGDTVGTYRFQTGRDAAEGRGFYSEREYCIDGLAAIRDQVCEVGRSCVETSFRGGTVIALLWAGLAELHRRMGFRYMMGCMSLSDRDPVMAWSLFESRCRRGELSPVVFGRTRPAFGLPYPQPFLPTAAEPEEPLFKGYLRLGAKIASEPAWDRHFRSIDFLILLDFNRLSEKYARHFSVDRPADGEKV